MSISNGGKEGAGGYSLCSDICIIAKKKEKEVSHRYISVDVRRIRRELSISVSRRICCQCVGVTVCECESGERIGRRQSARG